MTALGICMSRALLFASSLKQKPVMRFRLLRHASLVVEVGGKKLLVDPMLSKKEAMDPVQNAANSLRIPMVDLPLDDEELAQLLHNIDAVVITHTHRDHWDTSAQQLMAKDKLIICQPADEAKLKEQGFTKVHAVDKSFSLGTIIFHRTDGQHGKGEIGKKMGPVSGFVIEEGNTKLFIAGDTIWCPEVKDVIIDHNPIHIIVNGGGARFLQGDAITMTTDDIIELSVFASTKTTIVHLDTINHCLQRRTDFKEAIEKNHLKQQFNIPDDGEWITV